MQDTKQLAEKQPQNKTLWFEVDSQLVARSSRMDESQLMWLWYLSRYIDQDGASSVYLDNLYAVALKAHNTLSKARFESYLRKGVKAGYWTLTRQGRRGEIYRRRLFYTSYEKVAMKNAQYDGTNYVGAQPHVLINLRWKYFLPHSYAAWMRVQIERKLQRRVNILGQKKRLSRLNALHISRQTLERVWGISVPTMIKWENIAEITTTAGFEQANENASPGTDIPTYCSPHITKAGKLHYSWRTINSYKPPSMRMSESKRTRLTVRRKCRMICEDLSTNDRPHSNLEQTDQKSVVGLPVPFVPISFDYRKSKDGFNKAKKLGSRNNKADAIIRVFIGKDQRGHNRWERVVDSYGQTTLIDEQDRKRMDTPEWAEFNSQFRLGMASL